MNFWNYIWFTLLALLWSGSFLGIKITVEHFPPLFCAMVRVFISLVFLTAIFGAMRAPLIVPFSTTWRLWIAGLFVQGIPFALLFYGERFIAPALAAILNSTVPIWALLLNLIIFRDIPKNIVLKILGLAIGLAGVMVIFIPRLEPGGHNTIVGLVAVIGMAICYGLGSILTQHVFSEKAKYHFQASVWQQHCSSLVFLLISSLTLEQWPSWHVFVENTSWDVWVAFIYLGLFSTAIAWIIFFHLIKEWGAVRASSVTYIMPVLAIYWDSIFLHLKPGWNELIGAALILIGVAITQVQKKYEFIK